jgi:3(or 17)beta-hydroxysteroid dehydrogenase
LRDRSAARGPLLAITNLVATSTTIPCHCGNFAEARASTIGALADWHRLCGVNLTGPVLGTKVSVLALRASGQHSAYGSAIVNLASVAGLVGSSNDLLYSMPRAGSLCSPSRQRSNSRARATRGRSTPIWAIGVLAIRARNMSTNDLEPARQQTLNRIPIGRMGTATDIAKGIVFLASDDSGFMTGAGLVGDGSITAQ